MGWECPKCGACYAPFVAACFNCTGKTATVSTISSGCSCGTSLPCMQHPVQKWSLSMFQHVIDAGGV